MSRAQSTIDDDFNQEHIPTALATDKKEDVMDSVDSEKRNPSMIKSIFSGNLPKSFGLIIGNEFCERFCFYGMRAILTLYLKEFIGVSNVTATNIYHVFTLLAYFMPIAGAILSDSWLGKFRTILYLSFVYAIGTTLMSILAIPSVGNRNLGGVITALVIIAVGTGGIKPCVSAFGADQFQGETQYLEVFFNAFYMSINAGSVLSMIITPLIKGIQCLPPESDPECTQSNCDCYALAFGIPAILMVIAIVFFVAGTRLYIRVPPQGSMLLKFAQSLFEATKNKVKKIKPGREATHWLDYAGSSYDLTMLNDFKQVLSVIGLFAPLCFFWTLYDQTGSTWVIQGTMMFHKIGNWNLTPDLIQAVNPIMVLILVPLFDSFLYPFCAKFKFLTTSLQRMVVGMLLAALSFLVAGFIQIAIVNELNSMRNDTNISQFNMINNELSGLLRVHNTLPCQLSIEHYDGMSATIDPNEVVRMRKVDVISSVFTSKCVPGVVHANRDSINRSLLTIWKNADNRLGINTLSQSLVKRVLNSANFRFVPWSRTGFTFIPRYIHLLSETTKQTSIHILFQLIQYFILTSGEVLFSISGLHFAYAEAPVSMKSVMTAVWLLTNSIGNLITVIINSAVGDRSDEVWLFFLYAGLIVVVDILFILLVRRYKPSEQRRKETEIALAEQESKLQTGDDDPSRY